MQKTPLAESHEKLGARMVDFAGWWMPVTYTSIQQEHTAVRTHIGLFDVSHMGRYFFSGPDHIKFVDHIITNHRAKIKAGAIRYALVLNEQGGIMDDVLVYSMGDEGTMLVVNAGNRESVSAWINVARKGFAVDFEDWSDDFSMIALQGPKSHELLAKISDVDVPNLGYYKFTRGNVLNEPDVMVSRTGYTGEDGFELIMENAKAASFWERLLELGSPFGIEPCGLGARDTLRLEAGMPLHGHEIAPDINPLEAGLKWAVKLKKEEFVGHEATRAIAKNGPAKALVGLEVAGKRIPRQHQKVTLDGIEVGEICSGTKGPWVEDIIATAYVPADKAKVGSKFQIAFPSRREGGKTVTADAVVVPMPFYTRPDKKKK